MVRGVVCEVLEGPPSSTTGRTPHSAPPLVIGLTHLERVEHADDSHDVGAHAANSEIAVTPKTRHEPFGHVSRCLVLGSADDCATAVRRA